MDSDRHLQLISPPPEESLRRQERVFSPALNTKRKRGSVQPEEPQLLTPNPRSKKQPKQRATPASPSPLKPQRVVVQSPHAHNPNADYIPPTTSLVLQGADSNNPKQSSRRSRSTSATPIPPYEPPTDIFTPPKEVFVTPVTATIRVSKSSKRKSTTVKKKKPTPTPVVVKLEMPDVDLTAPMPPPSPGDDPLLLSSSAGPESSTTPTKSRTRTSWLNFGESEVGRHQTKSPTPSLPFHKLRFDDLPPSSSPGNQSHQTPPIIEEEDLDITPPEIPFFDLGENVNVDDGWSDDEGDDLPMLPPHLDKDKVEGSPTKEGEGEFTGKWLEVLVRTKADPPSSATRGRMDEWGNPKSPFPLSLEKRRPDLPGVAEEAEDVVDEEERERERQEEEEVRRMSVEPEEPEVNPFDFSGIEDRPQASQTERASTPVDEGPSAEGAFKLMGNQPGEADDDSVEEPSDEVLSGGEGEEQYIPIEDDIPPLPSTDEDEILPPADPPLPAPASVSPVRESESEHEHEEQEYSSSLPSLPSSPMKTDTDIPAEHDTPIEHHESLQPQVSTQSQAATSTREAAMEISPSTSTRPLAPGRIEPEPEADTEIAIDQDEDIHNDDQHDTAAVHSDVDEDEDGSSSDSSPSPDVVKITSADPRAAARAAAILKQHNYDCFTKLELKRQRRRHSDLSSASNRRRNTLSPAMMSRGVLGGGIVKGYDKAQDREQREKDRERRKTVMGVQGERVYIPGSPLTTTLPKLLKEAEAEVSASLSMNMASLSMDSPNPFISRSFAHHNNPSSLPRRRDSYKTPLPSRVFSPLGRPTTGMTALANKMDNSLVLEGGIGLTPKVPMTPGETCYDPLTGERMWTKEEWKRLDACFTDERLEVGARRGLQPYSPNGNTSGDWESAMASADDVNLEDVIKRFVDWMGGWQEVDEFGPEWSRENLVARTKALRSKQRKGNVAPPTSLPFSPSQTHDHGHTPSVFLPSSIRPSTSDLVSTLNMNKPFGPTAPSPFDLTFKGPGFDRSMEIEMDIPEFTPIRPRSRPVSVAGRVWPPPEPEAQTQKPQQSTVRQPLQPTQRREWNSVVFPSPSLAMNEMDVCASTPFPRRLSALEKGKERESEATKTSASAVKPVPKTLLAPRYSHLLEEAQKISKDLPDLANGDEEEQQERQQTQEGSDTALEQESEDSPTATTLVDSEMSGEVEDEEDEEVEEVEVSLEQEDEEEVDEMDEEETAHIPEPPATIGGKVKGLLFSYLPTLRKTPSASSSTYKTNASNAYKNKLKSRHGHAALPLPPQEILSRHRGPVVTPAKEPLPKLPHPKDLVNLQQAPPVQPPASKIPRVVHPKNLVELNHVTPKVTPNNDWERDRARRQRRSSGSSVKDLIKGFEDMEKEQVKEKLRDKGKGRMESEGKREVRRMKSVGEWRKDVPSKTMSSRTRAWKP